MRRRSCSRFPSTASCSCDPGAGSAQFRCLPDTWRAGDSRHVSRDDLEAYLNPVPSREFGAGGARYPRVVDREDAGQLPLFPD